MVYVFSLFLRYGVVTMSHHQSHPEDQRFSVLHFPEILGSGRFQVHEPPYPYFIILLKLEIRINMGPLNIDDRLRIPGIQCLHKFARVSLPIILCVVSVQTETGCWPLKLDLVVPHNILVTVY